MLAFRPMVKESVFPTSVIHIGENVLCVSIQCRLSYVFKEQTMVSSVFQHEGVVLPVMRAALFSYPEPSVRLKYTRLTTTPRLLLSCIAFKAKRTGEIT
jgi:hypothetical protein